MKSFLKKAGKVALVFFILILVGIIVALGIAFFFKNRELNNIYSEYNQATQNLNQSDKQNQITIGNLQDSYKELNSKIDSLTKENTDLKAKLLQEGFGAIKGTILPFLVGDSTTGQYQLVCAQSVSNGNIKYCLTVPALSPKFTMALPEGKYTAYAQIISNDGKTVVPNYQANYTEYIKCVVTTSVDKCDKSKLSNSVQVEVKAGQTATDINPTDWVMTKVTP